MSRHAITPGQWFLGSEEIDRGEHGWDGKVWAPPAPDQVETWNGCQGTPLEFDLEPEEIATVATEADARLICAAKGMLALLRRQMRAIDSTPMQDMNHAGIGWASDCRSLLAGIADLAE